MWSNVFLSPLLLPPPPSLPSLFSIFLPFLLPPLSSPSSVPLPFLFHTSSPFLGILIKVLGFFPMGLARGDDSQSLDQATESQEPILGFPA